MGGLASRGRRMAVTIVGAAVFVLVLPSTAYAAVVHSTYFAGYQGNVSGAPATFAGSLTIPTVTCPATGTLDVQPGVDLGVSSGDSIGFFMDAQCYNGSVDFLSIEAAVFPSGGGVSTVSTGLLVSPGDVVKMSAKISGSPSKVTVAISDPTTLASGQATEPMTGSISYISAGTFVYGDTSPTVVPNFTPVKFSGMKIGGLPLGGFGLQESKMYNGTTLQVSTSSLSSTGTSFSNTFVHS